MARIVAAAYALRLWGTHGLLETVVALLGAAEGSAGTGPAAIPDGNLIPRRISSLRRDCIDHGRQGLRSRPTPTDIVLYRVSKKE